MTPAEHRTVATKLVDSLAIGEATPDQILAAAQVHATLALAPAPPPSAQPPQPQQRIDTSRPVFITDITATQIHISKSSQGDVYIAQENNDEDCAWGVIIDDPTQLRLFAAALTAHADRLEPKP